MRFSERLRLLRNKRYEDWWHIVFGGPLGVLAAAAIADVAWITANRLTIFGFILRLLGAAAILCGERSADLAAVALLQISIVVDIMDGSVARYRKKPSALGAFLDKITDGFSLAVIGFCLGARALSDGHGPWHLGAGAFIGASYLLRCYMYWVVAYLEKERAAPATVGPRQQKAFGDLSFAERMAYYARSSWRIVLVGEGDVYFWVGLFLLLGCPEKVLLPLAGIMAIWLVLMTGKRLAAVVRLDRAPRPGDGG